MQRWRTALIAAVSFALLSSLSVDATPVPKSDSVSNVFSTVDGPQQRPARDITTALMRRWRLRSMVASGLGYPDLGFEALELTSLRLPLAQTYSALEVSVPDTYW